MYVCVGGSGEAPITPDDIYATFVKYVERRIPIIPWCEAPLQSETEEILSPLVAMNKAGFLTINSQVDLGWCFVVVIVWW